MPAAIALWLWSQFPACDAIPAGHWASRFYSLHALGLEKIGIHLTLGLNGISLPLFVLAGIVGFAAGLYALQSGAERLKIYLMLLLIMQGGLMGAFASIDIFFFYFFHELALIPTFIMVGVWGTRSESENRYAAMKMAIYLTVGRDAVAARAHRDLPEKRRGELRPDQPAHGARRERRCGGVCRSTSSAC